jgi:rubrerythrin
MKKVLKPKILKSKSIFCRECGYIWIEIFENKLIRCPSCGIIIDKKRLTKNKNH